MANNQNIFGCFVSSHATLRESNEASSPPDKGEIVRTYIWGEFGICTPLKSLKRKDYGEDLQLILLQFYVLPMLEKLINLKEIERYRPRERAIGIPIIIHDDNFFNRSNYERREFLRNSILERLDLLSTVVKRNKLDTKVELLKSDVNAVLS